MRILNLWREPLLHFLLLGAALFVFYASQNEIAEEAPKRIVVTGGQVEQLVANFERTWSRPPNPGELEALIESHIRDEVFYREALVMGLDQNDPIVRRRMRQKLEFMLEDLSSAMLDDSALQTYFTENADRYRADARISFRQVYLNPERHDDVAAEATRLLNQLNAGAEADSAGDPTLIAPVYRRATTTEIARDFGQAFAEAVAESATGSWQGPLYSAFGAHLVYIDERVDARAAQFDEVRDRVRRDYLTELQQQQKDFAYRKLREGYSVTVQSTQPEQP